MSDKTQATKPSLIEEAVRDARALKDAAVEAAKAELVEQMTPRIRAVVEKTLRAEGVNRQRRAVGDEWPGESHTGFEENRTVDKGDAEMDHEDNKELDMEALMGMVPSLGEDADVANEDVQVEDAGEGGTVATEGKKDKDDEKVDESLEISEEAFMKVFEDAAKSVQVAEVQIKKGFGEPTKMGELDDVSKDSGKGLNKEKGGEHPWEGEEPPAKQDFTVKEAIRRGLAENEALREENEALRGKLAEAMEMVEGLHGKLNEVNLFHAKVMHVNRVFQKNPRLTREQKMVVIESVERASSLDEVTKIYETIDRSFRASAVTESRGGKPTASAARATGKRVPDNKVLRESVDPANNSAFSRMQLLAGLVNGGTK